MMSNPSLDENSAPTNDWGAGRSRRGGCLMLTSVFLIFSSCDISINGSTSGASFGSLAKLFRSSWEKLVQGTRSYLPSPTLICTPASLADPANTSPVSVSPLLNLNVSAKAAWASNPHITKATIRQNLRTMRIGITDAAGQRKHNCEGVIPSPVPRRSGARAGSEPG